MKIYDISQANETYAWEQARLGKITGTKAAGLALEHYAQKDVQKTLALAEKAKTDAKRQEYLTRARKEEADNRKLKVGLDFWRYMAETLAQEPDGEPPMERGHRLENENALKTLEKLGIPAESAVYDTGLWVNDADERLAVSPDVHEDSLEPTWAIECKSLGSAYHLQAVLPLMVYQREISIPEPVVGMIMPQVLDARSEYDLIPDQYKAQVLQYFVVDARLKTLYFSMYDDRFYNESIAHRFFTVRREQVKELVEDQRKREMLSLSIIDKLTEAMGGDW